MRARHLVSGVMWQDSTEFRERYGPGGPLRCRCGFTHQVLGPFAYADTRVVRSNYLMDDASHATLYCPKCKLMLEVIYYTRPAA